jgi:hypothetical protein
MTAFAIDPNILVTELLSRLNSDTDYNFTYTKVQYANMVAIVARLIEDGIVFSDVVLDDIIGGPDMVEGPYEYELFEDLVETIDQIFNMVDEDGGELEQYEQPFNFDGIPRGPIK